MAAFEVERWADPPDLVGSDHLAIDPQVLVYFGAPTHRAESGLGVSQREVTSLGIEQVVVEVLRQFAKQSQAFLVEADAVAREIIRPHDGRVSARVPASQ